MIVLAVLMVQPITTNTPAQAAGPGSIQAPFPAGEAWYICQGYNSPTITHDGKDEYALDLVVASTDIGNTGCLGNSPTYGNSASGRSVTAPANGTVAQANGSSGSMCINLTGGGSVLFAHLLNHLAAGSAVSAGTTQLGTVAPKGQTNNRSMSHIHIQAHSASGCTGDTVPFSADSGFRFCGNADMPNKGGTYQYHGEKLISQNCDHISSGTPVSTQGTLVDFDGDGFSDILWYGSGTAADYIWFGTPGKGVFDKSVSVRVNGTYTPFTGDFDGDGHTDIFWYAPGPASDWLWFGTPTRGQFASVGINVNGTYTPISGHFNDDNYSDVLWYGPGSSPDYIWYSTSKRGSFDVTHVVNVSGTYIPIG